MDDVQSISKLTTPALRILIADDFKEWRDHIRRILSVQPTWEIVAEACDGQEAIEKAEKFQPDVVLLDIGMPVINGLRAARIIRQKIPATRIIFVTQTSDEAVRQAALELGASGYVLKVKAVKQLVAAIANAGYAAGAASGRS